MGNARHILVIENDRDFRESLELLLETKGYTVFTASSSDEARELLRQERIHVALIDIRLEDDSDPDDISGLILAGEIDSAIARIFLTGYYLSFEDVREALGRYKGGIAPFADFIAKQSGPEALLQVVERVFRDEMRINYSLGIEWSKGLSLRQLVEEIEDFKDADEAAKMKAEEELEELYRKLFWKEDKIKVYYMTPGRGGSGVALVRPFYSEVMEGELVVVKFGRRKSIEREVENYREYVEPFVLKQATAIVGTPAWTPRLGATKFLFRGLSADKPQDFNAYYRDADISEETLHRVIENIFKESCWIWYKGKRDWTNEDDDLVTSFEKQLSLDETAQQKELADNLAELLKGRTMHRMSFRPVDDSTVEMKLGSTKCLLLNPLAFIRKKRHLLPNPSFVCITHGDLNGHNIFIDDVARVWLIEFFKTGWGPALRDVGELESSIKFELLETNNLSAIYEFEQALLKPMKFSEAISFKNSFNLPELKRALAAITKLRILASEIAETHDMREYYAGLLFYALKMITWQGISSVDIKRRPTRQCHALLSAAMICNKLESLQLLQDFRKHWESAETDLGD
jgi:CheY-like chemotaxis protein